MATATRTFTFDSTAEGFSWTQTSGTMETTPGYVSGGIEAQSQVTRNNDAEGRFILSGSSYATIFSIPTTAVVTGFTAASFNGSIPNLVPDGGSKTSSVMFGTATAPALRIGAVDTYTNQDLIAASSALTPSTATYNPSGDPGVTGLSVPATTECPINLFVYLDNGNDASATATARWDNLSITISYEIPPTQVTLTPSGTGTASLSKKVSLAKSVTGTGTSNLTKVSSAAASLNFDASGESCLRTAALPSTGAWTISGWFKRVSATGATWQPVFILDNGTAATGLYWNDGTYEIWSNSDSGTAWAAGEPTTGNWEYLEVSYNGTDTVRSTRWLESGTQQATTTKSATDTTFTTMGVGSSSWSTEWLTGRFRFIRMWDAQLSLTELSTELSSETPVRTTNLNTAFDFDGTDVSGNGRNWTITNADTSSDIPTLPLLGLLLEYAGAGAAALTKVVKRAGSIAGTGTSAILKQMKTTLAMAGTGTAVSAFTSAFKRLLQITATGTSSAVKKAVSLRHALTGIGTALLDAQATIPAGITHFFPGWLYKIGQESGNYVTADATGTGSVALTYSIRRVVSGLAATATGTAAHTKAVGLMRACVGVGTSVLTFLTTAALTLPVTAIGTAGVKKAVTLGEKAASGVGTALHTVAVGLSPAALATGTAALLKQFRITFPVTATGVATLTKAVGKVFQVTATGVSHLSKGGITYYQTMFPNGIGSVARDMKISKNLTAFVGTGTAGLSRLGSFFKTLPVTAIGTVQRTVHISRSRALNASGAATLTKKFSTVFNMSASGAATIAYVSSFFRTLAASATGSATMRKTVGKILDMTALGQAVLSKGGTQFTKTLTATAIGTANLTRRGSYLVRDLASTAIGTANLTFKSFYGKILAYTGIGTSSPVLKQVKKGLSYSGEAAFTVKRAITHTVSNITAQGVAGLVRDWHTAISLAFTAVGTALMSKVYKPFSGSGAVSQVVRRVYYSFIRRR